MISTADNNGEPCPTPASETFTRFVRNRPARRRGRRLLGRNYCGGCDKWLPRLVDPVWGHIKGNGCLPARERNVVFCAMNDLKLEPLWRPRTPYADAGPG